ncbi:MAG TPA: OmpA family protein [Aliidongia sp.]|nr:OmpA family protein [Aliidongia sp.]
MPTRLVRPLTIMLVLASCASGPNNYAVFFPTDEQSLTPEGQKVVGQIAAQAASSHARHVSVEGYADGATPDRTVLAQARADAVAHALVDAGVPAANIDSHAGLAPNDLTSVTEKNVAARKVLVTLLP